MKNRKQILVEADIKVEYDPESAEFKNSMETYRIIYNEEGDEEDFIGMIVEHILIFGIKYPIESLGYVSVNGKFSNTKHKESWLGVNLIETPLQKNGTPKFTIYKPENIQ